MPETNTIPTINQPTISTQLEPSAPSSLTTEVEFHRLQIIRRSLLVRSQCHNKFMPSKAPRLIYCP